MSREDCFVGKPEDFVFHPREPRVPADDLLIFAKEAALGRSADESAVQPMTPERRRAFEDIAQQVEAIYLAGRSVDLPDHP